MTLEKYTGFGFKNRTSDEFNVYSVTSDATYDRSAFAEFEDKEESVEGQEGAYYFGTNMRTKPLPMTLYMDNIDRETYFDLQRWLRPNGGLGNLWFYEEPYKYYRNVKVTNTIDYGLYPFENADSGANVYTAELPVTFKSYDPYSYSFVNTKEDGDALGYELGWEDGTGILPENYTLPTAYSGITASSELKIYNGGNARTKPIITLDGTVNTMIFTNATNGDSFAMSAMTEQVYEIDCVKGQITENDGLVVGRFSGGFINLEGTNPPKMYTMTFTNGSAQVDCSADLSSSIVGREIVTHDGTDQFHSEVNLLIDNNSLSLIDAYTGVTGTYTAYAVDVNKILIVANNMDVDVSLEFPYAYI